ncbi:angiopoietin-related protein 3 [Discoglossus pictus]
MNVIILFLLPLALSASTEKEEAIYDSPPAEPKSRFAMLDDVRILANGLLQLGHGLKDFVHKTKGQINEIFQKLTVFDKSFDQLSEQTNEIREKEEELIETTSKLQSNNEELKNMSHQIYTQIEKLLQDKLQLQFKVGSLEEKLAQITEGKPDSKDLKEMTSLKQFVEQQDINIRRLLKVVQDQHVQLDHQNGQIKDLEGKLSNGGFQESTKSLLTTKHGSTPISPNSTDQTLDQNDTARDCNDIYNKGHRLSGVYAIRPNGSEVYNVYCEITSENAWTVIQRRIDGSLDFNQTWEGYINGFGDLTGELWLGLEKMYSISQQADYILYIELEDWKSNKRYVEYVFNLGNKDTSYALQLSHISGNIPSALPERTDLVFSTSDRNSKDLKCPHESLLGGWWYSTCGGTNLNGKYLRQRSKSKSDRRRGQGLYWKPDKGRVYSLRSTRMMLYRTDFEHFD